MKTLLLLVLSLCSVVAFADDIPTIDLLAAQNGSARLDGQVVKLSFGWREGIEWIGGSNGKAKGKGNVSGRMKVVVPDAARGWFSTLPTQPTMTSSQSAYILIHSHAASELVGRTLKDGQPAW